MVFFGQIFYEEISVLILRYGNRIKLDAMKIFDMDTHEGSSTGLVKNSTYLRCFQVSGDLGFLRFETQAG
jgi:hypothetical protein